MDGKEVETFYEVAPIRCIRIGSNSGLLSSSLTLSPFLHLLSIHQSINQASSSSLSPFLLSFLFGYYPRARATSGARVQVLAPKKTKQD
jgi:hypothetical protein